MNWQSPRVQSVYGGDDVLDWGTSVLPPITEPGWSTMERLGVLKSFFEKSGQLDSTLTQKGPYIAAPDA